MKIKWQYLLISGMLLSGSLAFAQTTQAIPGNSATMPSIATPSTNNPGAVIMTDPAQTITVNSATPTFTIILASNKTTGYSWFLKNLDHQLVKVIEHKYVKPGAQMPGSPGYEVWTFRAKPAAFSKPRQSNIKLIYARPWEKTAGKEAVFKISTQP